MKFAAIILTFLVLTLSIVPDGCAAENYNQHTTISTTQQNPHNDDDCCKNCSPFYTCGTCIGFIISDFVIFKTPPDEKPVQAYIMANTPAIRQMALSIWQPPKLN